MMAKLVSLLRDKNEKINTYFKNEKEEISRVNLRILRVASVTACVFTIIFTIVTSLIISGWDPSIYHFFFFALMLIFSVLSIYLKHMDIEGYKIKTLIECFFVFSIIIFIIIMDTMLSPDSNQIFVSVFIVIAPVIFTVKPVYIFSFQIIFFVAFNYMTFKMKSPEIALTDFLAVFVGLVISFVLYNVVMRIRVEQYIQKTDYKLSSELDPLTGIANRATCKKMINKFISTKSEDECCAVMILDVDDFKKVNDTFGHAMGDEVLKSFATILAKTFRRTDVVGRLGGDEFVAFISGFTDVELVKKKCNEIDEQFSDLFEGRFNLSCSKGICFVKSGQIDRERLFNVADSALYEVKTFQKGGYEIHEYDTNVIDKELPVMVIVDDNQIDREIIAFQFNNEFEIIKFSDGEKALEYIEDKKTSVNVILLDMIMDGISGEEVLKRLKNNTKTKNIPVVIISADETTEAYVLEIGADDMIAKPFVPAVIKLRVRNAIKGKYKR